MVIINIFLSYVKHANENLDYYSCLFPYLGPITQWNYLPDFLKIAAKSCFIYGPPGVRNHILSIDPLKYRPESSGFVNVVEWHCLQKFFLHFSLNLAILSKKCKECIFVCWIFCQLRKSFQDFWPCVIYIPKMNFNIHYISMLHFRLEKP